MLLGIVLLGLTIRIGKAVIFNHVYLGPWPRNLGISGFLLVGPALWYYGQVLFDKGKLLSSALYVHFIPFLLFALFSKLIPNNGNLASSVVYSLVLLHLAWYLGLSWHVLYQTRHTVRPPLRSWYRSILIGITLILVLYLGIFVRLIPLYLVGATTFSFMIYIFSFLLLKKHHFALEKYAQSEVDLVESQALVKQVNALFKAQAPYLDSETSLTSVADMLDVKPRVLSQAINEIEQKNFSEFVNQYRIDHAKELLTHPERKQDKIATIAFDSGFGNITSFNTAFKTSLNITPSQYRKRHGGS